MRKRGRRSGSASKAVTLGADVTVLGGSGQQSERVLETLAQIWRDRSGIQYLFASGPGVRRTTLTFGNTITALPASQTAVRGPHPQRLRIDEADEMSLPLLEAAQGQPMDRSDVQAQTVISSTHQYPDGTMTTLLQRAASQGWHRASELSGWNARLLDYAERDPSIQADWTAPEWRAAVGPERANDGSTDPDATAEPRPTTIVRGDQFRLGAHHLRCGDSTDSADVQALLGDRKPCLMATDPPYGVEYDPKWRAGVGWSLPRCARPGLKSGPKLFGASSTLFSAVRITIGGMRSVGMPCARVVRPDGRVTAHRPQCGRFRTITRSVGTRLRRTRPRGIRRKSQ